MNRITYFEHGKNRIMFDGVEYSNKFVDRLAAYENSGLEPDEIPTGRELANVFCALEKLKSYEDAEKQGLLVKLPCKVGDTMLRLEWNNKTGKYTIISGVVKNVRYDSSDATVSISDGEYLLVVGRNAFLTHAEAEKALAERTKNERNN